ncbi:MAG TPA: hypothetical protein VK742_15245 [Candidatus Sulfotelmatobacter sp.]|nr:hypothetical protein [Candidatus Sulfotelmatobacter sp.]
MPLRLQATLRVGGGSVFAALRRDESVLVARHRMPTRSYNTISLIRGGNILCALFGVLTSWLAAAHVGYHYSTRNLVLGSIDLVWFFGALGLFFRWRIAWMASLAGAATSAFVVGSVLFDPSGWPTRSDAQQLIQQHGLVIFIIGFMAGIGSILGFFTIYFGLFIGLVRKRRELI